MQTPQNSSDFVSNISLSSDRVQHNITHALAEWKSTRALLSNVIQSYVATCVALQNFCTIPTHHPDGQSLVTDTLATVELELESLALEEATLRDMRVSLATTVNNSARLASINRLPSEILARIFEFSNTYCICHDGYRMNGVAGVCVYWRQVALDTPRLWTHVDVSAAAPHELSQLLLSRSESLPVHIHILDSQRGSCIYGVNDEPESEYLGESVMMALEFHLDRICTLNIGSNGIEGDLIFSVLDLWSKRGNASILGSLVINWGWYLRIGDLCITRQSEIGKKIESMSPDLSALHLRHIMFSWESIVYQGLLDLQIDIDDISISRPQLANILTACPALTTLKLSHLRIKNTNEWIQPPILMQHLEFVNLVCMESRDVNSVLSTITLPGPRAELGIKDSPGGALDSELAGFFGRSKVATLYYTCHPCEGGCDGCINNRGCEGGSSKALELFTQHLPYAHTFILHKGTLNALRANRASTLQALSTPLQPWLPKLILLECKVNFETLKRLVLETNIQELRLEQCTTAHHPAPDLQQQELKTIRASLQETYPHLRCWISDIDSTKQLSCRTMFYSD